MNIVFLDSWRSRSHTGSGTAVGIRNLTKALGDLRHTVTVLRPERGHSAIRHRVAFNLRVPKLLDEHRVASGRAVDLVVGCDLDGFRWGRIRAKLRRRADRRGPHGVPDTPSPAYAVMLKGVAADEAEYSRTRIERLRLQALGRLERANARSADLVMVPSRYSAEVAIRCYGLAPEKVEIVPEAVDLIRLEELRNTLTEDVQQGPTILSVARQYPRKDTATLLRALPRVRTRHPDVRLRVIGGGPELPRLRSLARVLAMEPAVVFEGAVEDDAAVQRAYRDAQIFCLPSRQEGFGIVFVEAMAAGIPVVAARAGAVPEVVVHRKTGLLVPPRDGVALAEALTRLLDDEVERRRLGAEGVRNATLYDLPAVGARFVDAVRPILRHD